MLRIEQSKGFPTRYCIVHESFLGTKDDRNKISGTVRVICPDDRVRLTFENKPYYGLIRFSVD